MTEAVLDASAVLKWFHRMDEAHADHALALRLAFEAGQLAVYAPPLLFREVINVAARRWGFAEGSLSELAARLELLPFELQEPELERVARWAAKGLTAYDAAYVAVADELGIVLITDDDLILRTAPQLAVSIAAAGARLRSEESTDGAPDA